MSIKFVVFAIARSGSSYLSSTLKSHPDICMHGEIFHEKTAVHIQEHARKQIDLSSREEYPIEFVKQIYELDQGKKAVGFKIWKNQNLKAVNYIIENKNIKKIVLERKNLLASFSSGIIARKTKVWNLSVEQISRGNYETPQVNFHERHFLKYVQNNRDIYNFYKSAIKSHQQDYLSVDYQKHIMNGDLSDVLMFLKIDNKFNLIGKKAKLNRQSNILERFVPEDHQKIILCLERINQTDWINENKGDE